MSFVSQAQLYGLDPTFGTNRIQYGDTGSY